MEVRNWFSRGWGPFDRVRQVLTVAVGAVDAVTVVADDSDVAKALSA